MYKSSYPVLLTRDVARTAAFYREAFAFEPTFESDWYVSLQAGTWELAVLDADHPTIPEVLRGKTADGVLLNLEVEDVDAEHARLEALGVTFAQPLRSEVFGQRHCIVRAPDGVLVDVITPIEPDPTFAAQFA